MTKAERTAKARHDKTLAVIDAVKRYDLHESTSWPELANLSNVTSVDNVSVDPEGVVIEPGGRFNGLANVFVILKYEEPGLETFEMAEGLLGEFKGHFDGDTARIDDLKVNAATLYPDHTMAS